MSPRAYQCPVCGAPLKAADGAFSAVCSFCGADIKLADPIKHHYASPVELRIETPQPVPVYTHVPAPPLLPAPMRKFLQSASFVLAAFFSGILFIPTTSLLLRGGGGSGSTIVLSIATALLSFLLYFTGRRISGASLGVLIGLVLFAKPFVLPLSYEGRRFSLTSETHLNYLVPGGLLISVFGFLLAMSFFVKKSQDDTRALRLVALVSLLLGITVSVVGLGGPTRGDVIAQYRGAGSAMRSRLETISRGLPKAGSLATKKAALSPPPIWDELIREQNNVEVLSTAALAMRKEVLLGADSLFSSDLTFVLEWTSARNPMAESAQNERDSRFEEMVPRVLGARYLAAYRPLTGTLSREGGDDRIEVFVWDLQTLELVAFGTTSSVRGFSEARSAIAATLSAITGGTFRAR